MAAATTELTFFATGYSAPPPPPDRRVRLTLRFGEPGYVFTAKMMAAAALTLLQERPACLAAVGGRGGVFTAGFLFRNSSLPARLRAAGFEIEAVHEGGEGGGGATPATP